MSPKQALKYAFFFKIKERPNDSIPGKPFQKGQIATMQ
jgi:hypothetical protein